jgi:hypothetical protein
MLNHSGGICKRRDADSFKISEGVSILPLYSYKKPCAGTRKGGNGPFVSAHKRENL